MATTETQEQNDGLEATISANKELDYADWSIRQSIDFEDEYLHNV